MYFQTPAATAPAAPGNLTAAGVSSSQINLGWTDNANNETGFKIERKTGTGGAWSQITTVGANVTSYQSTGLAASTLYMYRVRATNSNGDSSYSNEASATTQSGGGGPLPESPHPYPNSMDQTWTYVYPASLPNGIDVTFSSDTFVENGWDFIYVMDGTGANIQGSPFTGGQLSGRTLRVPGNTVRIRLLTDPLIAAYGFRVTAIQPGAAVRKMVFLIHGLSQRGAANGDEDKTLANLLNTLTQSTNRIDTTRFEVDANFDWACADDNGCDDTISAGGRALATYIAQRTVDRPTTDIILVGYSLGGLVTRDMMLNNYNNVLTQRRVAAYITLGTPHLGYPYLPIDTTIKADGPIKDMAGDFRNDASTVTFGWPYDDPYTHDLWDSGSGIARQRVATSAYLWDLNTRWTSISFVGRPTFWMAAGGRSAGPSWTCTGTRSFGDYLVIGCPATNLYSDGVVCDQSARFAWVTPGGPQERWYDADALYHHTGSASTTLVICAGGGDRVSLWNPTPDGSLATRIKEVINAVQ